MLCLWLKPTFGDAIFQSFKCKDPLGNSDAFNNDSTFLGSLGSVKTNICCYTTQGPMASTASVTITRVFAMTLPMTLLMTLQKTFLNDI
jgi:hypothetical protein